MSQRRRLRTFALIAMGLVFVASPSLHAQSSPFIVMASTTSTEQSGLFGHLLPAFTQRTGMTVRVVALGTGQALAVAGRGDADLLFVHDRPAEEAFVAQGLGLSRRDVMYNDFVIVGPTGDPAGVAGMRDVSRALRKIAESRQPFLSRGDKSGTHAAELRYWRDAGIDPRSGPGGWYKDAGAGMGPTLNIASSLNGYTLTDRATWLSFRNRGALGVLVEGDPRLFNQYGVIVVNPARHPHVKANLAQAFADWVVSPEGQEVIAAYKIGGEQLFFPNARP